MDLTTFLLKVCQDDQYRSEVCFGESKIYQVCIELFALNFVYIIEIRQQLDNMSEEEDSTATVLDLGSIESNGSVWRSTKRRTVTAGKGVAAGTEAISCILLSPVIRNMSCALMSINNIQSICSCTALICAGGRRASLFSD